MNWHRTRKILDGKGLAALFAALGVVRRGS